MQQVKFGRRQSVGTLEAQALDSIQAQPESRKPERSEEQTSSHEAATVSYNENPERKKAFSGVSRRRSITQETEKSAEEERKERNRRKMEESELVEDILEIPELGDDGEGDITTQVAAPPKEYKEHRMQSISQLDQDVQYHLPSETTIDLSMLTMSLSPADKIEEVDSIWTGETLLQELGPGMDSMYEHLSNDSQEGV